MYPQVFGERGRVAERFLAQPAPVWSLARVGPHVGRDGRRLRKPSIAYLAPKRLFAGVGAHVCCQIGRLAERLVAVVTPVRFFTRMRAQVSLERAGTGVRFAAYPAHIGPTPVLTDGPRTDRRTLRAAYAAAAYRHQDFGTRF